MWLNTVASSCIIPPCQNVGVRLVHVTLIKYYAREINGRIKSLISASNRKAACCQWKSRDTAQFNLSSTDILYQFSIRFKPFTMKNWNMSARYILCISITLGICSLIRPVLGLIPCAYTPPDTATTLILILSTKPCIIITNQYPWLCSDKCIDQINLHAHHLWYPAGMWCHYNLSVYWKGTSASGPVEKMSYRYLN